MSDLHSNRNLYATRLEAAPQLEPVWFSLMYRSITYFFFRTETSQNELSEEIAISDDLVEESVDEAPQENNGKSMRTLSYFKCQ